MQVCIQLLTELQEMLHIHNRWGVDNSLHWVFNMSINENRHYKCAGITANNSASYN